MLHVGTQMKYNPGLVGASQRQGRALFPCGALGSVSLGCGPDPAILQLRPGPRGGVAGLPALAPVVATA